MHWQRSLMFIVSGYVLPTPIPGQPSARGTGWSVRTVESQPHGVQTSPARTALGGTQNTRSAEHVSRKKPDVLNHDLVFRDETGSPIAMTPWYEERALLAWGLRLCWTERPRGSLVRSPLQRARAAARTNRVSNSRLCSFARPCWRHTHQAPARLALLRSRRSATTAGLEKQADHCEQAKDQQGCARQAVYPHQPACGQANAHQANPSA